MTYPVRITNQMASFLQLEPNVILTRITVTKLIWNYIKSNKLQSNENKKKIIPNKELGELFHLYPGQTLNLFTLFNHITNHIIGINHL
jgi:chromatin remodeling complex protein RSC6